uniref:Large polyvalent protein associated domain-containing protein n=1 Tax=viral metagenome TaxID=1070528 RepID=A0A6M3KRG2_9ZZZZ
MEVQLKDGRIVPFADDISEEEAKAYLDINYPEEPNVAQRVMGLGLLGMKDLFEKAGNIADTLDLPKDVGGFSRHMGEVFADRPMARQVTEHPATTWLGQGASELVKFAPQIPLYSGAGKLIFGQAAKIPELAGAVQKIMPVAGEGILAGTARAIPRAAIEGTAVGTLAQPEGTSAGTRAGRGVIEGAEFAAATAVLHPAFSLLGKMGRTLFRRYKDMGKVKEELAKKAEVDPAAAEELAKLNAEATPEGELLVPKGETVVEEVSVAAKAEQGELNLDPIYVKDLPEEVIVQFKKLGYSEADLDGKMPAKEGEKILEKGIPKSAIEPIVQPGAPSGGKQQLPYLTREEFNAKYRIPSGVEKIYDLRTPKGQRNAIDFLRSVADKESRPILDETANLMDRGIYKYEDYAAEMKPAATSGGKQTYAQDLRAQYDELVAANASEDAFSHLYRGGGERVKSLPRKGETWRQRADRVISEVEKRDRLKAPPPSPLPEAGEGVVKAPSGKKFTKAPAKDPDDIMDLQRAGFSGPEIKKMSAEEARDTVDRLKKVPEATPEQIARAEAIGAKVQEAALAREQAKAVVDKPKMTEEQRAQVLAEAEKDIAAIETATEAEGVGGLLLKLKDIEDPTLDVLIEQVAKTPENVKRLFEERRRALAASKPVEAAKPVLEAKPEFDMSTRKGLLAYRKAKQAERDASATGKARRARKSAEELQAEADKLLGEKPLDTGEPLGVDEMMKEDVAPRRNEVDDDGSYTLDSLGFQQMYEKAMEKLRRTKNVSFRTGEIKRRGSAPLHGTDIDQVESILKNGLRAGSALDTTGEWIGEYPVVVSVPGAQKGRYIEHNKFYENLDDAPVSRVTVDLEQYEHTAADKIKDQIADLAAKYPKVDFVVMNDPGVYKPHYTVEDLTKMYDEASALYKERNPKIDELRATIKAVEEKFRSPEGYIKNISREAREQVADMEDWIKLLEKQDKKKKYALESKIRAAEKDVSGEEGVDFSGDGTTLYANPIEPIYNWIKTLARSEKIKENAPSRKLVSEISGSTLSMRVGSQDVETTMQRVGRVLGAKLGTPEFIAMRDPTRAPKNPRTAPLIFELHKASFEGKAAASNQATTAIASRSLLTKEQELLVKGHIEGTKISTDPKVVEAAKMLKEELDASREMIKDAKRQSFKDNLNEDENAAISEVLAGRPIEEVIAKYKTHIVPDKLGRRKTRNWIDEDVIKDSVKEYQAIDTWGLDNYVTHFELGNMKIVSNGKLYARADSIEDAARKHIGLVERDKAEGIHRDYQLDTDYNTEALATGLSKRSYNRMVSNLQKGIAANIEGINNAMARRLAYKGVKDRFFITPTKKFSPFLEARRDLLQGEENIYDTIFHYFYSTNMKMALDPKIDAIRKAISRQDIVGTESYVAKDGTTKIKNVKKPYLSKDEGEYLQRLVEDIKGRYYPMDKLVDELFAGSGHRRIYSKTIAGARELQANLKLGYKPIGGMINYASAVGYLWSKTGTANIVRGVEFMRTPEGKAFTAATDKYLGVNVVESATGELSNRGAFEKLGWLRPPTTEMGRLAHAAIEPTGWFQMGEIPARRLTMATNYLMAKTSGLSDAAARDVAIKATWFTQFTYDMASLPEIMRGPTGRLVMQFKPYMFKALEFISTLRGDEWARYMTMQLALAGPRGLVMMLKSIPFIGAVAGFDKLEEWMNKEYPRLSRGVGGFFGVDVSAPATFALPQTAKDWMGPTLSNLVSLYQNIYTPLIEGKGIDGADLSKFAGTTFPMYRHWANIIEQVVDKDGWVKNERGQRMWQIDSIPSFVAKGVLGAEPLELNRIRTEERILTDRGKRIADKKMSTTDNVIDTIAKGKPIDPSDLEDMIKLGIKPGVLRRNLMYRNLTPMQRRLLNTEIMRRPEILEMYPAAADLQ